jgi:hypothetical protein
MAVECEYFPQFYDTYVSLTIQNVHALFCVAYLTTLSVCRLYSAEQINSKVESKQAVVAVAWRDSVGVPGESRTTEYSAPCTPPRDFLRRKYPVTQFSPKHDFRDKCRINLNAMATWRVRIPRKLCVARNFIKGHFRF